MTAVQAPTWSRARAGPAARAGRADRLILASGGGPAGDGEGGAIYNAGELWIVDCLFDGNLAAGGAGERG